MDIYARPKGFTLIEGLIVVAIIGIVASFAVSSWGTLIAQKRVRASMETLYDTLKLARSESTKQRTAITVSFRNYGGSNPSWCYGLSDSGNCDCRVANACTINGTTVIQTDEVVPSVLSVTNLSGADGSKYISFEGTRGTASNSGSIQFTNSTASGTVSINAMGFISNCSNTVTGYPSC